MGSSNWMHEARKKNILNEIDIEQLIPLQLIAQSIYVVKYLYEHMNHIKTSHAEVKLSAQLSRMEPGENKISHQFALQNHH